MAGKRAALLGGGGGAALSRRSLGDGMPPLVNPAPAMPNCDPQVTGSIFVPGAAQNYPWLNLNTRPAQFIMTDGAKVAFRRMRLGNSIAGGRVLGTFANATRVLFRGGLAGTPIARGAHPDLLRALHATSLLVVGSGGAAALQSASTADQPPCGAHRSPFPALPPSRPHVCACLPPAATVFTLPCKCRGHRRPTGV